MGGSNPASGVTSIVRGFGREIKDNPEKALFQTAVFGPVGAANVGVERTMKDAKKKEAGAANSATTKVNAANEAVLIANESVKNQKEKQRKQTIFGGASGNLFNKSLIGTSTTAAGTNQQSILGA